MQSENVVENRPRSLSVSAPETAHLSLEQHKVQILLCPYHRFTSLGSRDGVNLLSHVAATIEFRDLRQLGIIAATSLLRMVASPNASNPSTMRHQQVKRARVSIKVGDEDSPGCFLHMRAFRDSKHILGIAVDMERVCIC